jgi:hypothetical protein
MYRTRRERFRFVSVTTAAGVVICVIGRRPAPSRALASFRSLRKDAFMTREQVESAMASGAPFTLRMADGKEYLVPHRDYIFLPPRASYVIVHEDNGHFNVLPLLTMTGLRSKSPPGNPDARQDRGIG